MENNNTFKEKCNKPVCTLFKEQKETVKFFLDRKRVMILSEMGAGKTLTCIAGISILMRANKIKKTLIIAPKFVAESVWKQEIDRWANSDHIKAIRVLGNKEERLRLLKSEADVYIVSMTTVKDFEGLEHLRNMFQMVVIDETSKFRNRESQRFNFLDSFINDREKPFEYIIGLTGTPMPNGVDNLWSQYKLIDGGRALGKTFEDYQNNIYYANVKRYGFTGMEDEIIPTNEYKLYFYNEKTNRMGKALTKPTSKKHRKNLIASLERKGHKVIEGEEVCKMLVKDLTIKKKASHGLPENNILNAYIDPSEEFLDSYKHFAEETKEKLYQKYRQKLVKVDLTEEDKHKKAKKMATSVALGYIHQYLNGGIYKPLEDSEEIVDPTDFQESEIRRHTKETGRAYRIIHSHRLSKLKDIVTSKDASENYLVTYKYKFELEILKGFLKKEDYIVFDGEKSVEKWNEGKTKYLLLNPKSASHGLNLQYGGSNIIWFTVDWDLEEWDQLNARLRRLGQKKRVNIYRIMIARTLDDLIVRAIDTKDYSQKKMLEAIEDEFYKPRVCKY